MTRVISASDESSTTRRCFSNAISIYECEASRLKTAPEICWWCKVHENQIFVRNRKVCMVSLEISISFGWPSGKYTMMQAKGEMEKKYDDDGSKPSECETSAKKKTRKNFSHAKRVYVLFGMIFVLHSTSTFTLFGLRCFFRIFPRFVSLLLPFVLFFPLLFHHKICIKSWSLEAGRCEQNFVRCEVKAFPPTVKSLNWAFPAFALFSVDFSSNEKQRRKKTTSKKKLTYTNKHIYANMKPMFVQFLQCESFTQKFYSKTNW